MSDIRGFNADYRFLSNFHPCEIDFEGIKYPTVEHAYQAAKTQDDNASAWIAGLPTAGQAKRAGRGLVLREDWDNVKLSIMKTLLRKKFYNPVLKGALIATGNSLLVEENYWHDNFWGWCTCGGCAEKLHHNWLGNLLMETRETLVAGLPQSDSTRAS